MWGGFASTVFIPLIQLLLDAVGWRSTLIVLGAINLAVCAGVYWAVIDPDADAGPSSVGAGHAAQPLNGRTAVASAARQPVFWALALAFTAFTAVFSAFTFHFYPLLIEQGLDKSAIVAVIALIGPAQVAGRIGIWVFASRASVRKIGSLIVLVFPIALVLLEALAPSMMVAGLVAVLYGAANGIMTIVRGLAVPEMLTRDAYGAVNGALAAPAMFARAIAPVGAAMLWAMIGSYDAVLRAAIAGSLVLVIGFWTAAILSRAKRGTSR
ncbi:MAG: transporter [Xanthobacteraceae bacterium]|nr:transporter [Xanthobacteraceae bacterium]